MITTTDVAKALEQIEKLFAVHATTGPAAVLGELDVSVAAAGQHLPGRTPQRGLHGTAASIRVLGDSREEGAKEQVRQLLRYVEALRETEGRLPEGSRLRQDRIDRNEKNVIKNAELLYALSAVPTQTAPREELANSIASRLQLAKRPGVGWAYLMDGSSADEPAPLPTAHAVMGLAAHRFDVKNELEWLRSQLRLSKDPNSSVGDVSVRVFLLYVLCFVDRDWQEHRRELREWFDGLWASLAPLLAWDLEANIEYEVANSVEYVRVPWQLYLLACAARLRPYRRFATRAAQERLKAVLGRVQEGTGLIYPHSGSVASTRTNSILYDALQRIKGELEKRRLPLWPFEVLDRGGTVLRSRAALVVLRIVAVGLIAWSITSWVLEEDRSPSALAPDLLAAMILLVFASQRGAH